jgi:hypothetical protein
MRKCWAASRGDCSPKISGEHIVSAGLFLSETVTAKGFDWCREEAKNIGLSRLTKKVLCNKHNNALARVDEAGVKAFDAFRQSTRLQNVRSAMKPKRWRVSRIAIDGVQLERWFLKTLINVAAGSSHHIGSESRNAGEPSPELVEIAFGEKQFQPNAGLYVVGDQGETIYSQDQITVIPFHADQNYLAGATFYFRGFRFVLYLGTEGLLKRVNFAFTDGKAVQHSNPLYHPERVNYFVSGFLSHVVEFRWLHSPPSA